MPMPAARGPISEALRGVLLDHAAAADVLAAVTAWRPTGDVLHDDDVQVTLTMLYELVMQGLAGVDDGWEFDLDLLAARAMLEAPLAAAVAEFAAGADEPTPTPDSVLADLLALTTDDGRPGFSHRMSREAELWQLQELLVHRSLYQLREADPHTMGIPRLAGGPKGALVEVQSDEYGGGRPERMHSALFATTMREVGLDASYGAYVDTVPALTLASLNVLSYFAIHRSRLGALVGHLCAVEMTSSAPSRRYSAGLGRLGFGRVARLFYDAHVEADAMHEQIVGRDLAQGLARAQPHRCADILLGARVCLAFDELLAEHLTASWGRGGSSLRD